MSNGRLKLDDADFWTDAERTRPEITLELRQSEFKGVILDGPREVSLAERETCPLAGWWACDGYTDSVLRMPDALTVFSLDQRSHKLRRGVPLCLGSRPKRADVPKLSRAELERMTTREMFGFDLRQAVDLPWKGGTQVVAAVVREHLSEVLTIELNASGAGGYDDPAVAEFLAAQEQGAIPNPPPVSPPAAAPANALEAGPPEACATAGVYYKCGLAEAPPTREEIDAQRLFADFAILQGKEGYETSYQDAAKLFKDLGRMDGFDAMFAYRFS